MKLIARVSDIPIGAVAAFMGAATLSNAWNMLGFSLVRDITMTAAAGVWILYLLKIIFAFASFRKEYENTVPCSLFGAFPVLLMILSIWAHPRAEAVMKGVFIAAVVIHTAHILIFTFRNVLRGIKIETFLPSWFVTYNTVLVAVVIGHAHLGRAAAVLTYYGIAVYLLLIVSFIVRLARFPVEKRFMHTTAIVLAPISLCLVSYINVIPNINPLAAFALYAMLLLSFFYVVINVPRYFSVPFHAGFAGLTFPPAIAALASLRFSAVLENRGDFLPGEIIREIAGVQLLFGTAVIAFVIFNFIKAAFAKNAFTA